MSILLLCDCIQTIINCNFTEEHCCKCYNEIMNYDNKPSLEYANGIIVVNHTISVERILLKIVNNVPIEINMQVFTDKIKKLVGFVKMEEISNMDALIENYLDLVLVMDIETCSCDVCQNRENLKDCIH